MNQSQAKKINKKLMDIFEGLMYGYIEYKADKLACAMGTCAGEVFNDAISTFYMEVYNGHRVSDEEVKKMRESLISFNETYDVEEVDQLIKEIDEMLK